MVQVPASPSLNVGLGSGFTIEVWVNPTTLNLQELCEWNQNTGGPTGAAQIGAHMEINESPGDGSFWGNIVDTTGTSHNFHSANGIIVPNSFQHLAMTYDKASGQAFLYRNGAVVASTNFGTITPQTSFDFFMGDRPSGFFTGIFFGGEMDEPALYNRALAASEVQAIYNASSAGKCSTNPPPPSCTPAPAGMVSWWRAEGNANDSVNGNNGISQNVTSKLTNGKTFTSTAWVRTVTNSPQVRITLELTVNGSNTFLTLAPNTTVNTSGWTQVTGTARVSWSGTLTNAIWYVETASGTDSFFMDDASFQ